MYSALSLKGFDENWRATLQHSILVRPFAAIAGAVPKTTKIGTYLQTASFVVAAVLFAALGAAQFANDKEGLALIAAFGFVLWLVGYVLGGREKRSPSAIDGIVLLYFAANIISTGASHYLAPSIRGLSKVAVYILSYFYLTSILNGHPRRKLIILLVLTLAGFAVSMYGLYQYHIHVEPLATWEDPTVESKGTRIFSTLGNPNLLAGYLLPLIGLVSSLGAYAIAAKKWIPGVLIISISVVIAVATVLTGSRGGYLGLFAILGVLALIVVANFWINLPKTMRLPLIGAVMAAGVVGLLALHFVPGFEQRVTSIFVGREHSSNAFRMNVWHSSFSMFKDNWWFGIGPGNQTFRLAYGLYMTSGFDALGTYCVPLEVGVEAGILGLAAFAALIISLLARGHLAFWVKTGDINGPVDQSERWIAAGGAAALVGMMVHGMVDTVFYRPQVQFLFWLIVALLTTAPLPGSKSSKS